MLITQGSRTSTTQGSIISLKNIPLRYGPAKVVVSSYKTTTPSSLDRILTDGYVWTGSIYIDRIRDVIGADRVSIRKVR